MIDELGISAVIDESLPKTRNHILPHSAFVKAMLLNGLGFNERRLYFFSRFFTNLSTEQLFGPGVTPDHLNDDVLLRTFDKIYEYGSTDLLNKVVLAVMKNLQFGTHLLHADTTSFSVHGDYETEDDDFRTIKITYGHNKDHRWDLNQFVLAMVTNQHGIPLFTQPYSGKDEAVKTVYIVDSHLEIIPDVIEQEKTRLGRFILATNDLDLDPDSVLAYCKGQQSVERGFRFLKDKSFRVPEVFLKKKTRIEALSMIMVLCLLVYAVAEWHLRTRLKETKPTVKNQLKNPIQNPTMKWIFPLFMRPAEVTVTLNSQIQRFIVNLDEEVTQILALMGPAFEKYYFVRPTREM